VRATTVTIKWHTKGMYPNNMLLGNDSKRHTHIHQSTSTASIRFCLFILDEWINHPLQIT